MQELLRIAKVTETADREKEKVPKYSSMQEDEEIVSYL